MCFRSPFSSSIIFLNLIIFLGACTQARMPIRNPVVFIPGIMGSHLQVDGEDVWGRLRLGTLKPITVEGAKKVSMPLEVPHDEKCEPKAESKVLRHYDARFGWIHPFGGFYFFAGKPIYDSLYVFLEKIGYQTDTPRGSESGKGFKIEGLKISLRSRRQSAKRSSCRSFYYDWRRDNIENACLLDKFLRKNRLEIVAATRKEIKSLRSSGKNDDLLFADQLEEWIDKPFKFDVIAHSMGGLVARYYLRYGAQDITPDGRLPDLNWAGEKEIDKLILVGTPNLGSPVAMKRLMEGFTTPELESNGMYYHPAIIGTMPSMYQLLPRLQLAWIVDPQGNAVPLFDVNVWEKYQWGLMAKKDDPILHAVLGDRGNAGAKEYLRWCLKRAESFHKALDRPGEPTMTKIYAVSGILHRTLAEVQAHQGNGGLLEFDWSKQIEGNAGDGTVPTISAILYDLDLDILKQYHTTWMVPGEHLQLMDHEGLKILIKGILESTPEAENIGQE